MAGQDLGDLASCWWAFNYQGIMSNVRALTGNGGLCTECGQSMGTVATLAWALQLFNKYSYRPYCCPSFSSKKSPSKASGAHTGLLPALQAPFFLLTKQSESFLFGHPAYTSVSTAE